MLTLPLAYSLRNLWARRLTTALTAGGMALVVFVFAAVLMLDEGLRTTLVATGSDDNVVVIRRSSETEVQSGVERVQAAIVESLPEVALGDGGAILASKESVVLISLYKRGTTKPANVIIRGAGPQGLQLRPQVRLVAGRMFRPGSNEIIAGRAIAERFERAGLGERLRFGGQEWLVVGVFDAGRTGFDSEIWGDADTLMQSFRRTAYSSMVFKLADPTRFAAVKTAIEADPRLTLEAKRETRFYADQSETLSKFISILGVTLSLIFSVGAVIGAMITMYAAVASRVGEIGTLRALGFRRSSILFAFLGESLLLALVGGVAGLVLASFMQLVTISTMNWQSFAELAFSFTLTPAIVAKSLGFALFMGFVGGFLPAFRAARLNIVDALRAA
ncbi:putative ABC transporter protein [Oryzomicrobium terrae]|uniref:Putative ABC transporter protein n=1 Tax=Oryzomicrobium terrae TaxID=1735038 RepID=A0A5C1EAZ9_9RHOO|nr:ABC transporter permease [Oryzomicrobium terrae]QEL65854.1 putative ABC transporter protein [Oryzomicrobium terrae]